MAENSDKKTEPSPDSIRVMKLDTQLKQFIKKADITVAQLARASGVSAKTIYNWLEGQAPRNIQQVKKVAK